MVSVQSSFPPERTKGPAVWLLAIVWFGMLGGIAHAEPRPDRPFVIKPDGVVQRPNGGVRSPELDAAWQRYTDRTNAAVMKLADECFEPERADLLQDGKLPVTPQKALESYWKEVTDARAVLHGAYNRDGDPVAAAEWKTRIATQLSPRFPEDGEYLLVEDLAKRSGRILRVEGGLAEWVVEEPQPGAAPRVRAGGKARITKSGGRQIAIRGLENPQNKRKVDVSVDTLTQTYDLRLMEADGRHVRDVSGRIMPLLVP